jgi:hypothetical protein
MKPDWSTAPSWAEYLAMDANGAWWWYANKPLLWCWDSDQDEWKPNGGSQKAVVIGSRWQESLEERPVHKSSFDYDAEGK